MLTDISPPTAQPGQLGELATYLRFPEGFGGTPDDALRAALFDAAMRAVEAMTARVLVRRNFLLRVARWTCPTRHILPVAPVIAIDAVTIGDAAGGRTDVAAARWRLDPVAAAIRGAGTGHLPAIPCGGFAELRFVAGHGPEWADVPADLRHGVLTLAASYYDNGRVAGAQVPADVSALLAPYRRVRL